MPAWLTDNMPEIALATVIVVWVAVMLWLANRIP